MALENVKNMRSLSDLLKGVNGSTTRWGGRYVETGGEKLPIADVIARAIKVASDRNDFSNITERKAGFLLRDQLIQLYKTNDAEMKQRCILVRILAWLRDLFHHAGRASLEDTQTSDHYDGTASSMTMLDHLTQVTKKEHDQLFPGQRYSFDPSFEPTSITVSKDKFICSSS